MDNPTHSLGIENISDLQENDNSYIKVNEVSLPRGMGPR